MYFKVLQLSKRSAQPEKCEYTINVLFHLPLAQTTPHPHPPTPTLRVLNDQPIVLGMGGLTGLCGDFYVNGLNGPVMNWMDPKITSKMLLAGNELFIFQSSQSLVNSDYICGIVFVSPVGY